MGPFSRKAAEVVEEVVAIEAEGMSTAVTAVLGFIAFLYGATVIVFLYQESKVGQRHRPDARAAAAPPRRRDSAALAANIQLPVRLPHAQRCRRLPPPLPPPLPLLPPPPPPPQVPPQS